MKPMTTHHLGRRSGRACLGGLGHLRTNANGITATRDGSWAGSWNGSVLAPATPWTPAAVYARIPAGSAMGFGTVKHSARHLDTRST